MLPERDGSGIVVCCALFACLSFILQVVGGFPNPTRHVFTVYLGRNHMGCRPIYCVKRILWAFPNGLEPVIRIAHHLIFKIALTATDHSLPQRRSRRPTLICARYQHCRRRVECIVVTSKTSHIPVITCVAGGLTATFVVTLLSGGPFSWFAAMLTTVKINAPGPAIHTR